MGQISVKKCKSASRLKAKRTSLMRFSTTSTITFGAEFMDLFSSAMEVSV